MVIGYGHKPARSLVIREAAGHERPTVYYPHRFAFSFVSSCLLSLSLACYRSRGSAQPEPPYAYTHMFHPSYLCFPLESRARLYSQTPPAQTWTSQPRDRAEEFEGGRKEVDIQRNSSWALYHLSCRTSTSDCPWSKPGLSPAKCWPRDSRYSSNHPQPQLVMMVLPA